MLLGSDLEHMNDAELARAAETTDVFAKLTPEQKARIVSVLRENGHTVGFMGDGINDAAAMKSADIGISVDTAVDVAKESADIILLEKDLMVLEQGIIEGRENLCQHDQIHQNDGFLQFWKYVFCAGCFCSSAIPANGKCTFDFPEPDLRPVLYGNPMGQCR